MCIQNCSTSSRHGSVKSEYLSHVAWSMSTLPVVLLWDVAVSGLEGYIVGSACPMNRRYSVVFKSGDLKGQRWTLTLLLLLWMKSLMRHAVWGLALSCWNSSLGWWLLVGRAVLWRRWCRGVTASWDWPTSRRPMAMLRFDLWLVGGVGVAPHHSPVERFFYDRVYDGLYRVRGATWSTLINWFYRKIWFCRLELYPKSIRFFFNFVT